MILDYLCIQFIRVKPHHLMICWTGSVNAGAGTSDNSCGVSGECDDGSKGLEGDKDEPKRKRRKTETATTGVSISREGVQEPRVLVQSSTDSEILGDGFRCEKYGQKTVKGIHIPGLTTDVPESNAAFASMWKEYRTIQELLLQLMKGNIAMRCL
uniref:Uncharacterized protein n=1 Tax=Salix viminalis TaxID=40686 RepID=A0A6N2L742_SALVM